MRRLLVVAAVALACSVGTARAASDTVVYIRNVSSVVTDAQLLNELPAYQAAITEDFAPVWGSGARLEFIGQADAPKGGMSLTISDDADVYGALGYHDVAGGVPFAKVFAGTSLAFDFSPQIVVMHELEEMLADPWVNRFAKVRRRFYLIEVGDPVEDAPYAYTRPGLDGTAVLLSDFVTPQWYRRGSHGPYDFRGFAKRPLSLLPGGYVSWWDGHWYQAFAALSQPRPDGWTWTGPE